MSEPAQQTHGVCLWVAYEGTAFAGFQRQPDRRTVQSELERAIAVMAGHAVRARGAGRTDAGVHALGQVVAFDSARLIPPRGWKLGLNQLLPDDLRIRAATPVASGYAPRFDARGKTYRYLVQVGDAENPLLRHRAWQLGKVATLDVSAMRQAAGMLEGTHDYRAFRSADDRRENSVRTIWSISLREGFADDPTLLAIDVHGTAFMKNMVRILTGTLVEVGMGKLPLTCVPSLLGERAQRCEAGRTAPAHGLTLVEVKLGRKAGGA